MHVYLYIYILYVYFSMYVYMLYICIFFYVCICMYIYIYVCIYICMYIYKYILTQIDARYTSDVEAFAALCLARLFLDFGPGAECSFNEHGSTHQSVRYLLHSARCIIAASSSTVCFNSVVRTNVMPPLGILCHVSRLRTHIRQILVTMERFQQSRQSWLVVFLLPTPASFCAWEALIAYICVT